MKWLTKAEIARRSKKSYKEALLVSIEHHQQIAQSTRKEFFTAVGENKVSISSDHCGVCLANKAPRKSCGNCFLKHLGYSAGCGAHWKRISSAIHEILTGTGQWSKVVVVEKDMIKVLKKELKKQKGA